MEVFFSNDVISSLDIVEAVTIIVLIISNSVMRAQERPKAGSFLLLSITLATLFIFDAIMLRLDGIASYRTAAYIMNFIIYIQLNFLSLFLLMYGKNALNTRSTLSDIFTRLAIGATAISVVLAIVNIWNPFLFTVDNAGVVVIGDYQWISNAPSLFNICMYVIMVVVTRTERKHVKVSLLLFPVCTAFCYIQAIALKCNVNYAPLFVIYMLLYSSMVYEHNRAMEMQRLELMQQKIELNEKQTKIMLGQIQPHFLYNTITSIMALCQRNPDEAVDAMADFADHLRNNLDSLREQKAIPFSLELNHIETYVRLEKLRFGEKLTVNYHIEEQDFIVPTLTIQPLVENAIKHGVTVKRRGGIVELSTRRVDGGYEIIVRDDGIGFDKEVVANDGKKHVGIENVRNRLQLVSNATLSVESVVDEGTTAIVFIPEEDLR